MSLKFGFASLYALVVSAARTVRFALFTVSVLDTFAAGKYKASPACDSVIVVVPAPVIVMVLPLTVATAGLLLVYVIGMVLLVLVAPAAKFALP